MQVLNLTEDQKAHLVVRPYVGAIEEKNKEYFLTKLNEGKLKIIKEYEGKKLSKSGYFSDCYLGLVEDENVYFYLMDDPGMSGYNCCGGIVLNYSENLELIKEQKEFLRRRKKGSFGKSWVGVVGDSEWDTENEWELDSECDAWENLPQVLDNYLPQNLQENLPPNLQELYIEGNQTKLENLPNLQELYIESNQITKLENLPDKPWDWAKL